MIVRSLSIYKISFINWKSFKVGDYGVWKVFTINEGPEYTQVEKKNIPNILHTSSVDI